MKALRLHHKRRLAGFESPAPLAEAGLAAGFELATVYAGYSGDPEKYHNCFPHNGMLSREWGGLVIRDLFGTVFEVRSGSFEYLKTCKKYL
jgi:hypothetical protein